MKHISTYLSILALIAVGVLYYLHFNKKEKIQKIPVVNGTNNSSDFRIAYFDIDSLQSHYQYFKDALKQMKSKESAVNAELGELQNKYQRRITELQQKGPTMSQSEGEAAQREYIQMQQKYQEREQHLKEQLQNQQIELQKDLRKKIENFLQDYNKDKGYAFILSYEPGFMMYYKDTLYDITDDLVEGLNEQYKIKKKD
jgi:outer membrane protein